MHQLEVKLQALLGIELGTNMHMDALQELETYLGT